MSRRLLSFRTILVASLIVPLAAVGAVVAFVAGQGGEIALREAVAYLGDENLAHVQTKVVDFLKAPRLVNRMNAEAVLSGLIDSDDAAAFESLFIGRIGYTPSVTSVYFGNNAGGLVNAGREGPGGDFYVILTDGFTRGPFRKYSLDSAGKRNGLVSVLPEFDARTRPWYQAAAAAGGPAWTAPFHLFTGQDRAISAVHPLYGRSGELLGVFSVDISLSLLNEFLSTLTSKVGGVCFITDRAGNPIASSVPWNSEPSLLSGSVSLVLSATSGETAYRGRLETDGNRYYVNAAALPQDLGLDWVLYTVHPEGPFLAKLRPSRTYTTAALTVLAALAVGLALYLAYVFSRPLRILSEYSLSISRNEWPDPPAPLAIAEAEGLRLSLVSMRQELRAAIERLNAEIAEKNAANDQVRALLAEKDLILREVHHRMKNNMNVVMGLLSYQADSQTDSAVSAILYDAYSRVSSMMLLYDRLYRSDSFLTADAAAFLSDMLDELSSHYNHQGLVSVDKRLQHFPLPSKVLVSLGLIVTEAATNAFKHAFSPGAAGSILVELSGGDGTAVLSISDDGIGLRPSLEAPERNGFGLKLIRGLSDQLGGKLRFHTGKGTRITLEFRY